SAIPDRTVICSAIPDRTVICSAIPDRTVICSVSPARSGRGDFFRRAKAEEKSEIPLFLFPKKVYSQHIIPTGKRPSSPPGRGAEIEIPGDDLQNVRDRKKGLPDPRHQPRLHLHQGEPL
ncbi:MAG: hypothetical protein IKO91_00115, partial [Oscillospiraceae bacterium]|nr:hypothetical protein [Oscillospiraceae bacterium]